jgi:hypothetical protein
VNETFMYTVKKLTENSVSLTGCNRLTCKGDGKLFQHVDQVNPTSSDDDDGIFRNQLNFPTVNLTILTENFEIGGIFQRVFVLTRRSFPTIFRQLSDNKSKSKAAVPGLDPMSSRITTCYSTTAPHSLYMFGCVNCFYLRHCCVFLRQYSVHLRQYCVLLRQYCVKLRQYCVFLRQYSVYLRQDCVFLRQNCVNFRQFCVFLRQNSVHLHQNCVFLRQYCVKLS